MVSDTENTLRRMPKSIATAICQVMAKVKSIEKDNENKFDKYTFASIDDFMAFINPLMAEAGLIILQDESSKPELMEKEGKSSKVLMLWCEFYFTLCSKEGDLYGPLKRSVFVQATGAQAFGSAQSYALKQFLRSLFMIPTGDKDDPDNKATETIATPPTIDVKAIAARINRSITAAKNTDQLDKVSVDYNDDLLLVKTTSQTAYDFLMDAIKKRSDNLNAFIDKQTNEDLDEQFKEAVGK